MEEVRLRMKMKRIGVRVGWWVVMLAVAKVARLKS